MKRRCLAEAFGTFCLVFAGSGAVIVNQLTGGSLGVVGVGLVFGLVIMVMIYAVGHISGAHMNPAVTFGFFVAKRHPAGEIVPYIAAQLAGATTASLVLRALFLGQHNDLGITLPSGSPSQSFFLELVLTLILVVVILEVATGDREESALAGVAIGGTIALEAIFAGPICGASMNPARSFAPALISGNFAHHWIYWLAPLSGGYLGATLHRLLRARAVPK